MKTSLSTLFLVLTAISSNVLAITPEDKPFAIAIHGGAGTISKANLTAAQEQAYRDKLQQAIDKGYKVLEQGGTSLQAVQTAINIMEDSPLFNAGKGAVYTFDGGHELDAAIMDGNTMNAGAIAGVKHIKNPIDLAIAVMEKSPHVMLSGAGAEEFALSQGMTLVAQSYFDTESRYQQLLDARQKLLEAQKTEQQAWVSPQEIGRAHV